MKNLVDWWNRSSRMDRDYGASCYQSYLTDIHNVWLNAGGKFFSHQLVAAFAMLSPNNSYDGNLRTLDIVLKGFNLGVPVDLLEGLTTYRACAARAYRVLGGEDIEEVFTRTSPKTYNFYHNILNPWDSQYVTIDGHMYNLWRGERATLKDVASKFNAKAYVLIANDFKTFAQALNIPASYLQGTLWWCYKRTLGIQFDYQIDLW